MNVKSVCGGVLCSNSNARIIPKNILAEYYELGVKKKTHMFIMELSGLEIQLRCAYVLYKEEFGIYYSQAAEC